MALASLNERRHSPDRYRNDKTTMNCSLIKSLNMFWHQATVTRERDRQLARDRGLCRRARGPGFAAVVGLPGLVLAGRTVRP